jgi:hypothetical protein
MDFHERIPTMNLAALLMGLVAPMVARVLIALSFTAITFTGVTALVGSLVATAQSSWSAMPTAVLQLVTLSGIPQVLGMLFGAMVARVAMWAVVAGTRYVASGAGT